MYHTKSSASLNNFHYFFWELTLESTLLFPILYWEEKKITVITLSEWVSEVTQLCPILCEPMDCSLPDSSIHGIFQARILEWVAISFSRRSSQPREWTQVSHIVGRCFTVWATREDHNIIIPLLSIPGHCYFSPVVILFQ